MVDDEAERRATEAIAAANAGDPERVVVDGSDRSLQAALGEVAATWVDRLDPSATAAQRLAARAHHLRRWERPRADYTEGRAGYLRWRRDAKARHAEDLTALLEAERVDAATVAEAARLVRKEGGDVAAQVHEDAVCLAFLTLQLDAVAGDLGETRAAEVLRRTVAKMSPAGREAAAGLPLSAGGRRLLEAALVG